MARPDAPAALILLAAALFLAACGSSVTRDGPPRTVTGAGAALPADAIPRPEPRSRYGNGPVYEVFGKRYTVMDSSAGYSSTAT